jgi:hypothetical protein
MYQRFPGANDAVEPSVTSAPQSIVRAVRVMYAGAVVSLIGIIISLTQLSSIKNSIETHNKTMTQAQLNNAYHAEIVLLVVSGVIGAALWFWMARTCGAGKSWARIVSTVLFAIETVNVIANFSRLSGGGVSRFYGIVVWLIGLAAIVLLWQRQSSDYFRSAPPSY